MLDQLASLKSALRNNIHDDIADVRLAVQDWGGAAAESFKSYLGAVETATVISAEESAVTIAGEGPDEIIHSMWAGLRKLDQRISVEESALRAGLVQLTAGLRERQEVLHPPFVHANDAGQVPPNISGDFSYTLDDFRPPGAEPTGSGAGVGSGGVPHLGEVLDPAS